MESGQLSYQQGESLGRDNPKFRLKTKKRGPKTPKIVHQMGGMMKPNTYLVFVASF